jgi:hypothetical protein
MEIKATRHGTRYGNRNSCGDLAGRPSHKKHSKVVGHDVWPAFSAKTSIIASSHDHVTPCFRKDSQRLLMNMLVHRRDKALEQRMRLMRFALELRMKLARDEKGMFGDFDDFHQLAVRRNAAEDKTRLFKFFAVCIVEFVPVPMTFMDNE